MQSKSRSARHAWGLLVILTILFTACQPKTTPRVIELPTPTKAMAVSETAQSGLETPTPGSERTPSMPFPVVPASQAPAFAVYKEPAIQGAPGINQPAIAPDLSNVYNPFALAQNQLEMLAKNGFVVSPGTDKEFYMLYEKARYDNKPIFLTTDSMLHTYHLLFDKVLRTAERQYFIELLRGLNQAMLTETDRQYQALKGTSWEDAALRSVAFVGVASKLLDPSVSVPDYAAELVEAELKLVNAASGILPSPIFPGLEFGEDYTQYIPRGHYTLDENLKAYFRSMMWYGRMTFRLKTRDPEAGRAETRSAILVVNALRNAKVGERPALDVWQDLYSPTAFFVGRSDDLTALQYGAVMDTVYGTNPSVESLVDEAKLDQFIELAYQLPPPKILGIVISDKEDVEQASKGLRFMGQRFVPDAYIFRELMYRNVGTAENRRGLPKGLDLPAAMGSERAYQILDQMGETKYENYDSQMKKMRDWLSSLSVAEWTETLYNTWLYSFYPLLEVPGEGYPLFMRSAAWLDKQLNTVLGSWTELKHDTILYAKQAYAEMGGGPPPPPPEPPKGYVEPVPAFYARLAALTRMTIDGLSERGMLNDVDRQSLERLEQLSLDLLAISEKELRNEPLTAEEYDLIRFIGGELEHLTMAAADSEGEEPGGQKYTEEEPQAAVIADVATDPGALPEPVVLEEGVGRINEIHAIVPIVQADGQVALQIAKGGVFSQYEFTWPASDRLTDEKWRQMLEEGQAPPLPDWISSFYSPEGEYNDLTSAVARFQSDITSLFWGPMYNPTETARGALAMFLPEIDALNQARQYIGHQLISSQFRSVDLQSDSKAVVTVREEWLDKLYAYQGDYPNGDEPVLKERGPYPLDVTYTLEFKDGFWQVTQAVYANQPPAW